MKKVVVNLLVLACTAVPSIAQNVFNIADPIVRYDGTKPLGSAQRPDPAKPGLQKWVSSPTTGISLGSTAWDASSYKAYFLNANNSRMPYRIKFPRSYNNPDSANKKYPVFLFLHGASEVGCHSNNGIYNNEKQLWIDGKLFGQRVDNNEFDGFLVYPQFYTTGGCFTSWGEVPIQNLLVHISMVDSMAKYIRADADRLLVAGLSGGGFGAWRMAQAYPQRVAKIIPSAAAGANLQGEVFVHVPIWFATGGKDPDPSPAQAEYAYNKMNDLGADIRYTQYPDLGHAVWTRHWAEPDFIAAMNDMHKANPIAFFRHNEFCPNETIAAKLGITGGFYAYEWQREGITIATQTNNVNTITQPEHVTSFTGNEIIVKSLGTYRVRFKRTASAEWSVFSPKPVVVKIKEITQTPPITISGPKSKVLPALDGSTTVPLQLPAGFLNYEWYRVSDNVQVGDSQIFNAPVGVYKARYSEQYGCGSLFSPDFAVVNANGAPKPDAPTKLVAVPLSRTSIRLTWTQGNGETGFEIYRATKAGGPYTFITVTAANAVTYAQYTLSPDTKYYYIIRAINNTGASAATTEAAAKTLGDNTLPTAPGNLQYRGSTQSTVLLQWDAATDVDGIKRYDIYANGAKMFSTTATSFNVFNLDSLKSYAFTVKAIDKNDNESPASNQVTGYTHRAGINYKYYTSTIFWSTVPDFNALTPVKSGITDSININNTSIKTDIVKYGFLWEGFIYVPVTATYTFETISDDGTKVFIDAPYSYTATPLVNNNGVHGMISKTGTVTLTQGYHSIAIGYFQGNYGYGMELYWSNNAGLTREKVPKNFFSVENDVPSSTPETGINYKYYTSSTFWPTLPDFNWLTPAKSGITDSININDTSIKTDIIKYGFLWEGFIYIPATATYTFETISDDGTKVFIDAPYSYTATPLISNNGVHGMISKTGTITLTRGYHSIAVGYFQGNYGYGMELYWSNNAGLARQRVPKSFFFLESGADSPMPGAPGGLTATAAGYNKINLTWTDNNVSEKGYEIFRSVTANGNYVVAGTTAANATAFTDSALNAATTYYYKLRAIAESSESGYSAEVNATTTTTTMPATPVGPTELEAESGAGNTVALSWNDNSTNETNYRVYRSTSQNNYQLIATLNANSNAYIDISGAALTAYYYYVVALNGSGEGEKSNTVFFKAGNRAPVFSGLANINAKTNTQSLEDFVVTDDEGETVNVTIDNKPAFVEVVNTGDNNYRITANPTQDNVGWYNLSLVATDNFGHSTTEPVTINVADKETRSVFIKVGTKPVVAPWNNWTGTRGANSVISNLKDENNIATAISLTSVTAWSGVNALGHITGNNSGIVPDAVLDNGLADNGATKQFRFTGLNPAMRYNIALVGSMNEGPVATATCASGTQSATLDARYNTTRAAHLNGLTPDASGQIVFTITRSGSSAINYLNAIILEEYAASTPMLNPENLYAEALDRNRIALSWSDRTSSEAAGDGYQLQRATDSLFTQNVTNIALAANTTSYINTGLVPNTKYWYRVRAKNGTDFSGYSNRFTVVTPASITYVNFNTTITNAPSPWNNLQSAPTWEFGINNLRNESGVNSGINFKVIKIFNGEFTAGVSTGNNSGVVPDNVLASAYWLDNLQASQVRLTGLNHSRKYRIGFTGSSSSTGWFKGNYTAAYTVNGKTVYLNSWMNSSKVVYIDDLVPNAAGELFLDFSTSATGQWAFNSGIIIHEYNDPDGGSVLYMSNSQLEDDLPAELPGRIRIIGYPNPFSDNINLEFDNSSASNKITAEVYDINGRIILRQNYPNLAAGKNRLKIIIPSTRQQTGVFLVTLKINGEIRQTIKMLRNRR